jgi:hypothetical protein
MTRARCGLHWYTVACLLASSLSMCASPRRDPALGPLNIHAAAPPAIGDHLDDLIDLQGPELAHYIGEMGPGHNFYNGPACRFGYD